MLLYIIRHGDPDYETDTLTERGRLQAEAVGKFLAKRKIDRVFSSPMGRAKETAAPLCRILNLECGIEPWSHEVDDEHRLSHFPDGVPKSITFIQNTHFRDSESFGLDYDNAFNATGINQSNIKDARDYIEACGNDFLERLGYKYENGIYRIINPSDEKVALFCHSVFTRVWLSVLFHFPLHLAYPTFDSTHTGVTILEFANNPDGITAPKLLRFSDTSHLYAEGLDLIHGNRVEI